MQYSTLMIPRHILYTGLFLPGFAPACLHSKLFTESLIHPEKFVVFFLKNNKKKKNSPSPKFALAVINGVRRAKIKSGQIFSFIQYIFFFFI